MANRTVLWIQVLLLLFLFVGPADALEYWWSAGTGGDGLWTNPNNWWQEGAPGSIDNAHIDFPVPAFCTVNPDTGPVEITDCYVGDWEQDPDPNDGIESVTATLDVNNQTLTVTGDLIIGAKQTIWYTADGKAVGDVNVINGGTINVEGDAWVGAEGIGYLNVRDGDVNIVGTLRCPGGPYESYSDQEYTYGVGNIDLYSGGTIEADDIYSKPQDEAHMNIRGGTLILNGDKRSKISDLINEGKLYAYGGGGDLEYDYNVTNAGKTTVTGTFDPNRAKRPDPGNYAKDVSLTAQLGWIASASAASHDVYFGTTFDDVNDANHSLPAGIFKGNQPLADVNYNPGTLAVFTTYYWRIDEVNDTTTWKGGVWRFTTVDPYIVKNPDPANYEEGVPSYQTLSWEAGIAANSHDVYIGSSFDEVNEASTPTATTVGDSNTSYTPPGGFLLGEVDYYWRVDEVNTVTATTWTGPVWKFTTANRRLIDNFEDYPPPPPPFTYFWKEGGNATVSLSTDSPDFVPDDTNALQLDYSNSTDPWDSNTTREIPSGASRQDWVIGGVEILGISFHGEPDNDVEQLYVTVKDADGNSATVLYSDSNNIVQWPNEDWRWWGIDLKTFSDAGVNLADVRKLTIGLGDGASPGGSGTVYFDDIGLYRPMCLNQDGDADLNNDCAVDINDIELLVDDWLESGYDVTATTASSTGLVVWYKFDEGSGSTATDSAGDYDGHLLFPNWESPGYDGSGSCVDFYDQLYIDVPPGAASVGMGGHSTVALWIKDDGIDTTVTEDIGTQLFQAGPSNQGNLQAFLPYNGYFEYTCGWDDVNNWGDSAVWGDEWGYSNGDHPLGQWVHYAFVKDATEGVMRIYQNGKIVAEQSGTTGLEMPEVDPDDPDDPSYFTIGAWQWIEGTGGYYYGLMDEFRLYNRALSQQEIMDLADVSALHQPVLSSAEVTDDDTVNFEDYAVVAAEWLEEPLLWP